MKNDSSRCLPCLIVATGPFTIIALNDKDRLETNLEKINKHEYDRVHLCRTTMDVDVGLGALPAILTYTAAWIFPPLKSITPERAVNIVNQVNFELLLGGIRFDSVAPEDVGYGYTYHTGYFNTASGLVSTMGVNISRLQALQGGDVSTYDSISLFKPRVYTVDDVKLALSIGRSIAKQVPELNPNILLDGLTAMKNRRVAAAIVFLWASFETLLNVLWERHVVPNGSGVNGRKTFIDGRSWSAAHKAEVLFQLGFFDSKMYSDINEIRKTRNDVAHNGSSPSIRACELAAWLVFSLLSRVVSSGDAHAVIEIGKSYQTLPAKDEAEPVAWRHLPSVPGDEQWGDKDYTRFPEREWVPLSPDIVKKLKKENNNPVQKQTKIPKNTTSSK